MLQVSERPAKGLTIKEAFTKWASHADVEVIFNLHRHNGGTAVQIWNPEGHWEQAVERCLNAIMPLLNRGAILASAITAVQVNDNRRKVIHPTLWDVLHFNIQEDSLVAHSMRYFKPEFFEPLQVPKNVALPEWLKDYLPTQRRIEFIDDYSRIIMNGQNFRIGDMQRIVLKALHEASLTSDPWCNGKKLLQLAGSKSTHLSDLFKPERWGGIIESDGQGMCRLATADS